VIRALLLVLVAASGCADDGGPRLDAVDPGAAARNATVTLTGQRLCGPAADCAHAAGAILLGLSPPQVHINVVSYTDTSVQAVIPSLATVGRTDLIATVDDRSSNALSFEVLP
jgi:hypothetical protein